MQVTITKKDYLTIKALFFATSKDKEREALSYVFYDKNRKLVMATSGMIVRFEILETHFNYNIFFSKKDFLKPWKDLKDFESVQTVDHPDYYYPNIYKYFPIAEKLSDLKPIPLIGISPTLISLFEKSIVKPKGVKEITLFFGFSSHAQAIAVYGTAYNEFGGTCLDKYLGIIMPCKPSFIHGNKLEHYEQLPLPSPKNSDYLIRDDLQTLANNLYHTFKK